MRAGKQTLRRLDLEGYTCPGLPMKPKRQGEASILQRIERAFGAGLAGYRHGLPLGIGDDAALLNPSAGCQTILTCDWFLEGSHFLKDKHPAGSVGWKCLARAVSDIAAMGGVPRCFLLSLAISQPSTGRWLDEFLAGLRRASRKFACPMAGGDTTKRADILIQVTVVGEVRTGRALRRSGARPGDTIYVSGRLGEAEAGLTRLRTAKGRVHARDPLLRKHLYPEPRLSLGAYLAENQLASAMMDLSDGLSSDLGKLCAASKVGARIAAPLLPAVRLMHAPAFPDLNQQSAAAEFALNGGDDYELLFTVRPEKVKQLPESYDGVALTPIGEVQRGRKILLVDKLGRRRALEAAGWDPFRARREQKD
jgi:thiamine-monophosphate kinase